MASFNGISGFFGRSVRMKTVTNPTAEQVNHFFGVSGSEALAGGLEGRVTLVSGIIEGSDASAYAAVRESIRALQDGNYYGLVDTLGVTWPYVRIESFDPAVGDRTWSRGDGSVVSHYALRLKHIA